MTQTTTEQVDAFTAILEAYLAEHPEQRLGQAIHNLFRSTIDGSIPTQWQLWDLGSNSLVARAESNYIRSHV